MDFWLCSLTKSKIIHKLVSKSLKTPLADKERHLLNYLDGSDDSSLLQLSKDSTTRKYGELAMLDVSQLQQMLETYFWLLIDTL